jgi:hypothetical protein
MLLDKIVIDEQIAAASAEHHRITRRQRALRALGWFARNAVDHPVDAVLNNRAEIIASATANADDAKGYVAEAIKRMKIDILKLAIEMAKDDEGKTRS